MTVRRSFALPFVFAVIVGLLACLLPAPSAFAADVGLPDWYYDWANFVDAYHHDGYSPYLGGDDGLEELLMNPDFIRKCHTQDYPAPAGMDMLDASRNLYTSYQDPVSGQWVDISDIQDDLYINMDSDNAPSNRVYRHNHDASTIWSADSLDKEQRLTQKSSTIADNAQAMGTEQAVNNARAGAGTLVESESQAFEKAAKAGKVPEKTARGIRSYYKSFLSGFGKVWNAVGVASSVAGAAQLGTWVGNGAVHFFHVDQTAECQSVTNGFARFALGISDSCEQIELNRDQVQQMTHQTVSGGIPDLGFTWLATEDYADTYCGSASRPITRHLVQYAFDPPAGKHIKFPNTGLRLWSNTSPDFDKFPWGEYSLDSIWVCSISYGSNHLDKLHNDSAGFTQAGTSWFMYTDRNPFDHLPLWFYATVCTDESDPSSCSVQWFQLDGPQVVTETAPASVTVTVQGDDGHEYTATGPSVPADQPLTVPSVPLPDGVHPTNVAASASYPDKTGATQTLPVVPSTPLPPASTQSGTLDLVEAGTGKSCYELGSTCATWADDVAKATGKAVTLQNTATSTSNKDIPYRCNYGGQEVAIGECTVLSNAFQTLALQTGKTMSDPETGKALDTPTQPAQYPEPSFTDCVKSGVSWNPVTWVYTPVSCALSAAFRPKELTLKNLKSAVDVQASNTVAKDLNAAYRSSLPATSTPEACEGPSFELNFLGYEIFPRGSHPMSVCPGSGLSFLPVISKAAITGLAGLVGLMVVRKRFSNAVGMQNEEDGSNDK